MTYTVIWKPRVAAQLAEIWISVNDRPAVTIAANALDRLLRTTPREVGESRGGDQRIVVISPLAIVYEIAEADRRVDVLAVRHLPLRPSSEG